MKRSIFLILLAALVLFTSIVSAADSILYCWNGRDFGLAVEDTEWASQTFTTDSDNEQITKIEIRTQASATGTDGTVRLSVKAVDGSGKPTGADLTFVDRDSSTLPTPSSIVIDCMSGGDPSQEFVLSTPFEMTPNTKYAIVYRKLTDFTKLVGWDVDFASGFSDGHGWVSNDSGNTWSNVTGDTDDFSFAVTGDLIPTPSPTPTPPPTPTPTPTPEERLDTLEVDMELLALVTLFIGLCFLGFVTRLGIFFLINIFLFFVIALRVDDMFFYMVSVGVSAVLVILAVGISSRRSFN